MRIPIGTLATAIAGTPPRPLAPRRSRPAGPSAAGAGGTDPRRSGPAGPSAPRRRCGSPRPARRACPAIAQACWPRGQQAADREHQEEALGVDRGEPHRPREDQQRPGRRLGGRAAELEVGQPVEEHRRRRTRRPSRSAARRPAATRRASRRAAAAPGRAGRTRCAAGSRSGSRPRRCRCTRPHPSEPAGRSRC